ncbi:hypothetical protein QN277_024728 [Acacia crassicarpa]|uniref:Uncharacterized protein n=1 Tax=Acacia crassicarpa TaxID=499986 RepID=A0AAE1JFF7_9FABA|nr:hypothetical protein QN277_024728 [Acacia crassicarpa]
MLASHTMESLYMLGSLSAPPLISGRRLIVASGESVNQLLSSGLPCGYMKRLEHYFERDRGRSKRFRFCISESLSHVLIQSWIQKQAN